MKIVQPMDVLDGTLTSSNVPMSDYDAHSMTKVYVLGDIVQVDGSNVHKVFKSKAGSTNTVTMTIASPCVVTWTAHGLADGTPISFTTTGALPTGIVANTVYYVKIISGNVNTFNITATVGGPNIVTTGTQSGVHTARASANYNKSPVANPNEWLDMGATNRWKMFDKSIQSQTSNNNSIEVSVKTTGYATTVALLNISTGTARLVMTHPTSGVVYDSTRTLKSTQGVSNWFRYFTQPARRVTDVIFEDLPLYANCTITVTLSNPGQVVKCGGFIVGKTSEFSAVGKGKGVAAGAKLGLQDYSVKSIDEFGNYSIVERAFSKKNDYSILIDNDDIDFLYNLLVSCRAKPTLYIAKSSIRSTIIYGFFKDFDIDIAYANHSICNITLESLT